MHAITWPRRIGGAIAVAAILAACSSGAGATPSPTVAPQPTGAAAASGTVHTVSVQQAGAMGAYLTGDDGRSLYLLTSDSAGTSTCTAACAQNWPPFTLGSGETVVAGTGVSGTLGTIKRPDGSDQVAINGIPLYYFSGDKVAGDTNGEGFKNIWFLVSPSGTSVAAPAVSPAASPAATKSSGGYGY